MCTDDCGCGCNEVISKRGLTGERGPAGPMGPQGPAGGGTVLDENIIDAINASNDPSDSNPFATIDDLSGFVSKEVEFIHNFSTDPLSGGTLSRTIATTLPLGTIIKEVNFKGLATIIATPTGSDPVKIQIGLESDDETLSVLPVEVNGIQHVYSAPTTIINRNIKITAIDGTITGGSISIIITKR